MTDIIFCDITINSICSHTISVSEWRWETPDSSSSWVVVSDDRKQVTFHPLYSSGTAAAKGDTPLVHNYHYYWEVKILTDTYGTDIVSFQQPVVTCFI